MPKRKYFPISMWFWQKRFIEALIIILISGCKSADVIYKGNKAYLKKWRIPIEFALLHYPELEQINIKFREKVRIVPLSTRPTWPSLFRPHHKRRYLITVSRKSIPLLNPIIFENLDSQAQLGVIGHEMAHVVDMHRFGFWGFVKHGFNYTFSGRYGDRFEYLTDSSCIAHGLGKELLAWSIEVRKKLGSTHFFQKKSKSKNRERYMNPETIENRIK